MDAVTMFLLAGLLIILSPFIIYILFAILKGILRFVIHEVQDIKRCYFPSKKEADERVKKINRILQKERVSSVEFHSISDPDKTVKCPMTIYTKFDETKDWLIKSDFFAPQQEPVRIYLYQPRMSFVNGVSAGPKYNSDGAIVNTNCYLLKEPSLEGLYAGYIPKREVLSNVEFDYFDNEHKIDKYGIGSYLKMTANVDAMGNFIPVNLNDPEERKQFEEYKALHGSKTNGDFYYFYGLKSRMQGILDRAEAKSDKELREWHKQVEHQRLKELSDNNRRIKEAQRASRPPRPSQHDIERARLEREIQRKRIERDIHELL